ncbi:MAG: HesB/IscA family protein [Chloroflexota bacterium]
MITVTERAKEHLKSTLAANVEEETEEEQGLRLGMTGPGQFGLGLDKEREGDEVVEHDGSKVLMVESELAGRLQGLTLDIQDTGEGEQLVMQMPPEPGASS